MAEKWAAKKKKQQESRKPRVKKPPAVHRDDNGYTRRSKVRYHALERMSMSHAATDRIANDPDLFQNWTWNIPHIDMEGSSETGESDDERQMGVRAELSTGPEQEQDRMDIACFGIVEEIQTQSQRQTRGWGAECIHLHPSPQCIGANNHSCRCATAPDHPDDCDSDNCDELLSDHVHTDGEDAGTAEEWVAANMGLQSRGVAGDAVFRLHDDPTTHPKELQNLGHASRMRFPITPSSNPTSSPEPQSRRSFDVQTTAPGDRELWMEITWFSTLLNSNMFGRQNTFGEANSRPETRVEALVVHISPTKGSGKAELREWREEEDRIRDQSIKETGKTASLDYFKST
ncbi:hypothetical protein B0H14DRAFT_2561485 [Mycena olivaceomarginata]|nr:hypothetical protein B0H14DRAFT_2561485 [Mycena olivaceomarginata]